MKHPSMSSHTLAPVSLPDSSLPSVRSAQRLAPSPSPYRQFLRELTGLLHAAGIAPAALPRASAADEAPTEVLIGRVQSYIDAHPSEDLSLDRLADAVHLSKYHFARRFKAETGRPPWTYVQEARVERAKTLLATTDGSLTEVALRAGFCDQSHLTRTFKQFEDTTPGAWRDEHAASSDETCIP